MSPDPRGWNVIEITARSCPPTFGYTSATQDCNSINRKIFSYLQSQKPDLIVAAGRYQLLFHDTSFDNQEGGRELGKAVVRHFDQSLKKQNFSNPGLSMPHLAILRAVDEATKLSQAIFVGAIPEAGWNVPRYMSKQAFLNKRDLQIVSTSCAAYEARSHETNKLLGSIDRPGYRFIDPGEIFCNFERCLAAKDGHVYYYDDDHLSLAGARLVAAEIKKSCPALSLHSKLRHANATGAVNAFIQDVTVLPVSTRSPAQALL